MEDLKEFCFNLESIYLLDAAICCKMRQIAQYLEGGVHYSGKDKADESRVLLGKYTTLQNYIHSKNAGQQITIAGECYTQIVVDGDIEQIIEELQPMQAHRYGVKWIFKTASGKVCAISANDTLNNGKYDL